MRPPRFVSLGDSLTERVGDCVDGSGRGASGGPAAGCRLSVRGSGRGPAAQRR